MNSRITLVALILLIILALCLTDAKRRNRKRKRFQVGISFKKRQATRKVRIFGKARNLRGFRRSRTPFRRLKISLRQVFPEINKQMISHVMKNVDKNFSKKQQPLRRKQWGRKYQRKNKCDTRNRTAEIERKYMQLGNLTEGLYALTEDQANTLPDLTMQQQQNTPSPSTQSCSRRFTQEEINTIEQVKEIYNRTTCEKNHTSISNNSRRQRRSILSFDNIRFKHIRKRSVLSQNQIINNNDGSSSVVRACSTRGRNAATGHLRLCKECSVLTILPPNRFPRFINEVICDPMDSQCLRGEGTCVQSSISLQFLNDTGNNGRLNLGRWSSYTQPIRTKCSCEILPTSILLSFLV